MRVWSYFGRRSEDIIRYFEMSPTSSLVTFERKSGGSGEYRKFQSNMAYLQRRVRWSAYSRPI